MTLYTLASSSKGNCALVSHNETHVLVDAGISMRRICGALKSLGLGLNDLAGILVTHDHTDHVSGLPMLTKHASLPIFAPQGAALALSRRFSLLSPCLHAFPAGAGFDLGGLHVDSFPTPHDAEESVGYCLSAGDRRLAFVTDLGYVTRTVLEQVSGADAVLLESNHDVKMLQNGDYPYYLKRRILGDQGHLSNDLSSQLAVALAESGTRCIILSHLSRENNRPELAEQAAARALEAAGILVGRDLELCVAPKDDMSPCFII